MSSALNAAAGILANVAGTLSELPPFVLQLGGVTFYDQEIPSSLGGGGEQTLEVHKYPGGARTIDTFGPDDKDIEWSGRFLDLEAEARCQQIDVMRRQGLPVLLTWSSYVYTVVIHSFTWTYERSWQIQYQISLCVQQDELNAADGDGTPSPNEQIQNDTADVSSNVLLLNSTGAG